jgi:UDP-N-acetylglucosamine 2-epimerase
MSPSDFLRLLYNSKCLIGNSSVGIRECSYLGVPVVNIGTRQIGRERGNNVIDVGYEKAAILAAARQQITSGRRDGDTLYGDGKAGKNIAKVLAEAPLSIEKMLTY